MANNSEKIIQQFSKALSVDLKKAIPVASGKTRDSLRVDNRKKGFTIFVGAQINAIIDGRKPTKTGAKKGSPTLQKIILDWIKVSSITPRESSMSLESLSWAISNSIHRDGVKGKGDIFAGIITKSRIDSLTKTILKDRLPEVQSDLIKSIKFI